MPSVPEFPLLRSDIAGVSVADLARQFGTPTYIYGAAKISERINDLRAFDVIRYAQKACSNLAILDFVRRQGVLVDAVSAGEVRRAMAAGYSPHGDPPPIIYTADIFDRESLDLVVELGLHVNCGSPDMIEQLGQRAPGSRITLRINPGFGHGHSQKTNTGGEQSKHGIWHEDLPECLRRADALGLEVAGLHMHIGSGTDLEHLRQVCGALQRTAREVGRSITTISAGGGLPVPYRADQTYVDLDAYFQLWNEVRRGLEQDFGHKVSLEIEPGRYLVAEAGYLVTEIRAIKRMGTNTFYLVDAGFNNLARPILYGSHHPMSIVHVSPSPSTGAPALSPSPSTGEGRGEGDESRLAHSAAPPLTPSPSPTRGEGSKIVSPSPSTGAPALSPSPLTGEGRGEGEANLIDVIVGGPLCESGDIFTQEEGGFVTTRRLPSAEIGDLLVLEVAGAYGFVMGSNYNSKPLAAEVLIVNAQPHLIRTRQTFEDLIRGERLLNHGHLT
jgi:diaminopimelate decarboxylase